MRLAFFVALAFVAACGPSGSSAALGAPRAARAETCELMLVSMNDVMPGGKYAADYETVGMVHVNASAGAQATDDDVKKEVRPRACALGGELVAPATSVTGKNAFGGDVGQSLAFFVYAKKSKAGPRKY